MEGSAARRDHVEESGRVPGWKHRGQSAAAVGKLGSFGEETKREEMVEK